MKYLIKNQLRLLGFFSGGVGGGKGGGELTAERSKSQVIKLYYRLCLGAHYVSQT